ncbi:hypothetical protein HN51_041460 [Arachis hypogaea]
MDRKATQMSISFECETLNQLGGLTRHQQKVHLQGKHEELLVHLRKMQEMGLGLFPCLHANHEMGLQAHLQAQYEEL